MGLRGARRDAEARRDLLVGATLRDQPDDLRCRSVNLMIRMIVVMRRRSSQARAAVPIRRRGVSLRSTPSVVGTPPRGRAALTAAQLRPSVSAPMRWRSSSSSTRWVCIISGPSVAIVKRTPRSANVRIVSRSASSSGERLRQEVRGRADLEHDAARRAGARISLLVAARRGCRGRSARGAASRRPRRSRRGRRRRPPRRRGS